MAVSACLLYVINLSLLKSDYSELLLLGIKENMIVFEGVRGGY